MLSETGQLPVSDGAFSNDPTLDSPKPIDYQHPTQRGEDGSGEYDYPLHLAKARLQLNVFQLLLTYGEACPGLQGAGTI